MQETLPDVDQDIPLAERRAFLQLPLEERRRQLAAQAEQMVEYYESELERTDLSFYVQRPRKQNADS